MKSPHTRRIVPNSREDMTMIFRLGELVGRTGGPMQGEALRQVGRFTDEGVGAICSITKSAFMAVRRQGSEGSAL